MSQTTFHFVAIPRQYWEDMRPGSLGFLAAEALSSERRLAKEINLAGENNRYAQLCRRLEEEAFRLSGLQWYNELEHLRSAIQSGSCGMVSVEQSYLQIVWSSLLHPAWERFGSSFFVPGHVETHRHAFDLWARQQSLSDHPAVIARKAFLENLSANGAGFVELQLHCMPGNVSSKFAPWFPLAHVNDAHVALAAADVGASTAGIGSRFIVQLRSQITDALINGSPVNFGNQASHDAITECLHEFVYSQSKAHNSGHVRVAYADGSEAEPFPVLCLPQVTVSAASKVIRVALLSMRHLSLDAEIDFCWFRNREVSRSWSLAEADAFCHRETLRQLRESTMNAPLHMILYHTGFEPACIGFYRALVEYISERRKRSEPSNISVEPRFFRGRSYEAGSIWA
jgi:hypothetical protein